jgi:5-methylcytosine-specific restriction endonuclease McrA
MKAVLVLNQDFSPLAVCSAERAFTLVFLRKAEMVSELKERALRTIDAVYPFPSVIRIQRYISVPYKGVILTRQNIFKRDNHTCQYCGTGKELTIDHLIPKSKGGKSSWTNLVTACKPCNAQKGDNTPEQANMQLKRRPVRPNYLMFLRNAEGTSREDWLRFLDPKREAV